MASFVKMAGGRWRVHVMRKGVRKSKVFSSKQAGKDWASSEEYQILNGGPEDQRTTFGEVCVRYAREVSPLRGGERWESLRLNRFASDEIGARKMADLSPSDFAAWRDRRLQEVKPASVAREMNLMSSVLGQARKEWGLLKSSPIADVRVPKKPAPRSRVPTDREMEALALSAGHDLSNVTARAFHAFLFACETAMRAGEIINLTWEHLDLGRQVAHLPKTKNGHPRDVALSKEAVRLIEVLPRADPVFGLKSAQLDALWRKLRNRAAVEGLTFHDSRRVGTTRMAKKLEPLELAKMTGHRDLNMLLNTYYKADVSDIAKKLD